MIASYIVTVTPKESPVLICPWEASPRQEEPDHAQTKFWLQRKMLPRNTFNFFHIGFSNAKDISDPDSQYVK